MSRVFVIGNAAIDLRLPLPRPPRLGETLLGSGAAWAPGGKGLNQAVVAARCGATVYFHAPLGHDRHAEDIEQSLRAEGIARLTLPRLPHASDFSFLMVFPDGENSIVSSGACGAAMMFDLVRETLSDLDERDIVLLQGNLSRDTTAAVLAFAKRRGAFTLFNAAPLWWDASALLRLCDLVIANRDEAQTLTGSSVAEGAAAALHALGSTNVVITLGADGCLLANHHGTRTWPAEPVDAVDTTGCGDTFCGVVAAGLSLAVTCEDAIALAQKAAALTALRPGAFAALPSRDELQRIIGRR
jgi:ribokinase